MTRTPRWSRSGRSPRVETLVPGLDTPLRGYSTTGADTPLRGYSTTGADTPLRGCSTSGQEAR